ncbi:phage minor head protein [Phenylobacterium sp.]|uniref:phage head morphogenesis protein n=1 Tax=Phenylobacterium sp. TaxID=1871053 RepID=UPI00391A880A
MADRWDFDATPDPRAVSYLEGKGLQRSWRWTSMWEAEHAYGFTLAGVHRLDVLQAAHQLVTEAVSKGETLEGFRSAFEGRLQKLGFAGPQVVTDFEEGPRKVDLSAPWRTRVIYDTNVRQAYASAEWAAIEDTAADFPALQYRHTPQEHPRLQHLAWDKVVLPVNHPFWKTHFPPNGWFCKCWTLQVSVDELASGSVKLTDDDALRGTGYTADQRYWTEFEDKRTGRTALVPQGVSPGFGFNAGLERRRNLGDLVARRVEGMDPNMARAAAADLTNLPAFHDLVQDAVALGQGRAAARAAAAARLKGGAATKAEIDQAAHDAADAAGRFPADSWPVGVAPADMRALAPDAGQVVVANASAIGHSAHLHPTAPADWRRVQALLERGEILRAPNGELTVFGRFEEEGSARTWMLALKPVAGAWRVRTLYSASPRRRAKARERLELVRPEA